SGIPGGLEAVHDLHDSPGGAPLSPAPRLAALRANGAWRGGSGDGPDPPLLPLGPGCLLAERGPLPVRPAIPHRGARFPRLVGRSGPPSLRRDSLDAGSDPGGPGHGAPPEPHWTSRIRRGGRPRLRNVLRVQQAIVRQLLVVHAGDARLWARRLPIGGARSNGECQQAMTALDGPTTSASKPRFPEPGSIRRLATLGAFLVVGLLCFPGVYDPPGVGLDPSWIAGLNLFADRGFRFGQDVIFTYGPVGYLARPL